MEMVALVEQWLVDIIVAGCILYTIYWVRRTK